MGETRIDFKFADGLRAIAALGVAVFHTYTFTGYSDESDALPAFLKVLVLGNFAVPIFIVLSGFVLMLPVARSESLTIRGGTLRFIGRRARRILPPYYAAIALFLLLIWIVPVLQEPLNTAWDSKIPITPGGVISHLLVIHNFSPDWIFQIDGPAWSVATEWQIYFAMPFLLLPLWRRIGPWLTVVVAVAVGWGVHFAFPGVDKAHFWFLGLFAMGMLAAFIVVRGILIPRLGLIVSAAAPLVLAVLLVAYGPAQRLNWLSETVLGLVVALALVWLSTRSVVGGTSWAHRALQSRVLVWIGLWSYSLYLVHSPLLALGNLWLLPLALPPLVQFVVMLLAVLPVALGVSYLFHLLVERRFMTSHQRKVARVENFREEIQ